MLPPQQSSDSQFTGVTSTKVKILTQPRPPRADLEKASEVLQRALAGATAATTGLGADGGALSNRYAEYVCYALQQQPQLEYQSQAEERSAIGVRM